MAVRGNIGPALLLRRLLALALLMVAMSPVLVHAARGTATAIRDLPPTMVALTPYTVSLTINASDPPNNPVAYCIEENYPAGWTVTTISDSGANVANDVRVGLFTTVAAIDRVVTYEITAPLGISGAVSFSGFLSVDGVSVTITGDTSVTVVEPDDLLATQVDTIPAQGRAIVQWDATPYPNLDGYRLRRDGTPLHTGLLSPATLAFDDVGYDTGAGAAYTIEAVSTTSTILESRNSTVLPVTPMLTSFPNPLEQASFAPVAWSVGNGAGASETVDVTILLDDPPAIDTIPFTDPGVVVGAASMETGGGMLAVDRAATSERTIDLSVQQGLVQQHVVVRHHDIELVDFESSGQELELFSGAPVRGVPLEVSLRISNNGPTIFQVITDRMGAPNSDVRFALTETDGTLLAEAYLEQAAPAGGTIPGLNKSYAEVAPGSSFLSESVELLVPIDAPDDVVLSASVVKYYHDLDGPGQADVPGTQVSTGLAITSPPYLADAQAELDNYTAGQVVRITGSAFDSITLDPEPNVPVKLGISVRGFDRFFTVNSDGSGNFEYFFQPFSTEAGNYALWAVHPDVEARPVQDQYAASGLRFATQTINVTMPRNSDFSTNFVLRNLGEDLQIPFDVEFDPAFTMGGMTAVVDSAPGSIGGSGSANVAVTFTADGSAAASGQLRLLASGNHGSSAAMTINLQTFTGGPVLAAAPEYVEAGVETDALETAATTISNVGTETLVNARVSSPSLPWIHLSIDDELGDIPAGQAREIPFTLLPDATVPGGIYVEPMQILSDNHIPFTVFFAIRVIPDNAGEVLVRAGELLVSEVPIPNLTVLLRQETDGPAINLTGTTDVDGQVLFTGLPPGDYKYSIFGGNFQTSTGTTEVTPGQLTDVHELISQDFVSVSFNVEEVTIEDRYEITLETTFQTDVLAPVMVLNPPALEIMPVAGTAIYNNLQITNHGFIAIRDVQFPIKDTGDFLVEPLVTEIGDLPAKTTIQVPFRIVTPYPGAAPAMAGGNQPQSFLDVFQIVCDVFEKCKFDPDLCLYGRADLCGGPANIVGCIKFSVLCKIIPNIPTDLGSLLTLVFGNSAPACIVEGLTNGGVPGSGCLCDLLGAITGGAADATCCKAITGLGLKDLYDCMCKYTKCDCPQGVGGLIGRVVSQGEGGRGGPIVVRDPCE